jgi:hypothetical protein
MGVFNLSFINSNLAYFVSMKKRFSQSHTTSNVLQYNYAG